MPVIARTGRAVAARSASPVLLAAALASCLAVALVLRLRDLGTPSPWVDEIATWTFAHLSWADLLGPVARVETNPPGHYALLKLLGAEGVTAMRLPSALAGALAVLPVALVALRAGGPPAAVMGATLLALSAMQIHHAQQARGFALLFLAVATALWLLGPLLSRGTPAARRAAATAGFAACCLVALHLHATAVVMVAALYAHALAVLAMRGDPDWGSVVRLAVAGVAILGGAAWWLRLALEMAGDPASPVAWIPRPAIADSAAILGNVLGGFHLGRLKHAAGALAALVLVLGAVMAWRRRNAEAVGLAVGFAFGALGLHSLSQVAPMMLERTALALLAFAIPLAAYALASLRPRPAGLALAALLLAFALRGTLMRAEAMTREGHGEDWRSAVALLEARAAPGDIVLLAAASELGALPWLAPDLAPRLRLRVAPDPSSRLDRALVEASGSGAWFHRAEACGVTVWALARDLAEDPRIAALALPPGEPDATFGRIGLRRIAMPPCGGSAWPQSIRFAGGGRKASV